MDPKISNARSPNVKSDEAHFQIPERLDAHHLKFRETEKYQLKLSPEFRPTQKFNSLGTPSQRVQQLVSGLSGQQRPKIETKNDSKQEEARKVFRGFYSDAMGAAQNRKNNLSYQEQKIVVSNDIAEMKKLSHKAGIPESHLKLYVRDLHRELEGHKNTTSIAQKNGQSDHRRVMVFLGPEGEARAHRQEAKKLFTGFYKDALGKAQALNLTEEQREVVLKSDIGQMEKCSKAAGISGKSLEEHKKSVYQKLYYAHLQSACKYYTSNGLDASTPQDVQHAEGLLQKAGISPERFNHDLYMVKYVAQENQRYLAERSGEKQTNQG